MTKTTLPRILFTGSQTWDDPTLIWRECDDLLAEYGPFVAVHGACPRGADKHVADWITTRRADGVQVAEEPHPADWENCTPGCRAGHRRVNRRGTEYCPLAGHRRNRDMCALGPYRTYRAFIRDGSSGATGCANQAERHGIVGARIPYPVGVR
ncbi:DUF2493 domain-containing protein [Actinosynnema sp. NPDC059335]|uniref:DUF2493 domain-containing protein n=1 Tax=Actinosynnema sp. NPDC059335 TaxID=3346804 RepID=UPI00366B42FA